MSYLTYSTARGAPPPLARLAARYARTSAVFSNCSRGPTPARPRVARRGAARRSFLGADDRIRTGDLVLTKDALCQLSYIGLRAFGASADKSAVSHSAYTVSGLPPHLDPRRGLPTDLGTFAPANRSSAAFAWPPAVARQPPSGLPAVAVSAANARRRLERETGIEPATNSLEGCDSTTELLPPSRSDYRSLARASAGKPADSPPIARSLGGQARRIAYCCASSASAAIAASASVHLACQPKPRPRRSASWLPRSSPGSLPFFATRGAKGVAREGFEPSKPLGRQIYSLLRLTASLPRRTLPRAPESRRRSLPRLPHTSRSPISTAISLERLKFLPECVLERGPEPGAGEGI